jgi:hypothetical protein
LDNGKSDEILVSDIKIKYVVWQSQYNAAALGKVDDSRLLDIVFYSTLLVPYNLMEPGLFCLESGM